MHAQAESAAQGAGTRPPPPPMVFTGAIIALTLAICLPFLRTLFWVDDEGVLLAGAERILHGEIPYRDFFEFLPPGGFLLTAAALALGGTSFLTARLLTLAAILAIALGTTAAMRRAGSSATAIALMALWLLMSQGPATLLWHHWLTSAWGAISMALCFTAIGARQTEPAGTPRHKRAGTSAALLSGLAGGMAAFVTPTRGAALLIAAATSLILARHWRGLAALCAGVAAVMAAMLLYLAAHGALLAAIHDVVIFPHTHYATFNVVAFGTGAWAQNYPLEYVFHAALALAALALLAERRAVLANPYLAPSLAFALAGLAGCYPRPDMAHVAFAAPFALPLLALSVSRLLPLLEWPGRIFLGLIAALPLTLSLYGFGYYYWHGLTRPAQPTPRGAAVFFQLDGAPEIIARISALPAAARVMVYPFSPMLSFLTARPQIGRYDVFVPPGYAAPSQYQEQCVAMMRAADWVVTDHNAMDLAPLLEKFPAMRARLPPETLAFEAALARGFSPAAREGSFELLQRTAAANPALCQGIEP